MYKDVCRALSDGGELGRLEVGEGDARPPLLAQREGPEPAHHRAELHQQEPERLALEDQVRVVGDVARSRAEVQDRPGFRALLAQQMHVRHDVVPELLLELGGPRKICVVEVPGERVDLRLRDGEPERPLGRREGMMYKDFYIESLREATEILEWVWRGWAVRGKLTSLGEGREVR
jgi:hypothetical protein